MTTILVEIARCNWPCKTKEQRMEAMEKIDPKTASGGIHEMTLFIACNCGIPLPIEVTSPVRTKEEIQEIRDSDDDEVIIMPTPGADENAEVVNCANVGHTQSRCPQCERNYIVCWEMEVLEIARDLKFPWSQPESPDDSSSGRSMTTVDRNETVH
jgi:hypothetical protein